MKVNRLENVFCNPPLPDDDYVLLSEAQAEIDTKNGIIQLHQTIEAKLKAEIDELEDFISKLANHIRFGYEEAETAEHMVSYGVESIALLQQYDKHRGK